MNPIYWLRASGDKAAEIREVNPMAELRAVEKAEARV